jgi:hypothetical protein
MKITRALRSAVGAYLSGAVVMATYLVWSALDDGTLEQQHPHWVIAEFLRLLQSACFATRRAVGV